jgi:prolyl oligopeptidase PreP (S9A serine peptidase family)
MPLARSAVTTFDPQGLQTGSDPVVTNTGLVAAAQVIPANRVVGRTAETNATRTTGVIGNNNAILFTSKVRGTAGNAITVALVDPDDSDEVLSVAVTGTAIVVSLATGNAPGNAITSTAAQVITAVNASTAASALVTAANAGASNGSAAVVAVAATALAGGADNGEIKPFEPTATDGTQIPVGILCHAVDTTDGAEEAPFYVAGTFHPDLLEWPASIQTESQRHAVFDGSPIHLRAAT